MSAEILLSAKNLCRYYAQRRAVEDLSLEIRQGEVLGLLGPNGAGKSTTLNMLSGCLAPSSGSIVINNIDLIAQPKRAKHYLGYLPELPPLYRDLCVDEYLKFCARLHRLPDASTVTACEEAKVRCGISDVGHRLIANLSRGYRQRVGIAQAIIHKPAVVILDEPTVGLDPIQIQEVRGLIRDLGNQHSVILSTHLLAEVQSVCDRVQIIDVGRTVYSGRLDEITAQHEQRSLLVAFAKAPSADQLVALDGIDSVECLDDGRYKVGFAAPHNPAAVICEQAVKHDWQLLELTPEQATLEQIFTDLIYKEQPDA